MKQLSFIDHLRHRWARAWAQERTAPTPGAAKAFKEAGEQDIRAAREWQRAMAPASWHYLNAWSARH